MPPGKECICQNTRNPRRSENSPSARLAMRRSASRFSSSTKMPIRKLRCRSRWIAFLKRWNTSCDTCHRPNDLSSCAGWSPRRRIGKGGGTRTCLERLSNRIPLSEEVRAKRGFFPNEGSSFTTTSSRACISPAPRLSASKRGQSWRLFAQSGQRGASGTPGGPRSLVPCVARAISFAGQGRMRTARQLCKGSSCEQRTAAHIQQGDAGIAHVLDRFVLRTLGRVQGVSSNHWQVCCKDYGLDERITSMGHTRHHAILITTFDKDAAIAAHQRAVDLCQDLVSEIRESAVNGYYSFAIFPDCSSESW